MRKVLLVLAVIMLFCPMAFASANWPNEPAGSTLVVDCPFSNSLSGMQDIYSSASFVQDPTAPLSPSGVLDAKLAAGASSGGVHISRTLSNIREVYIGTWWKTNAEFQGLANNSNKLLFVASKEDMNILNWSGPQDSPKQLVWVLQSSSLNNCHINGIGGCDGGVGILYPNVTSKAIAAGSGWHRIEVYQKASATGTSRDGIIRWWLDGVLLGNYTNVNLSPSGFNEAIIAQTWDGSVFTSSMRDMNREWHHYWDHFYISSPNGIQPTTTAPTTTPTVPASSLTPLLQAFPGSLTLTAPQGGANPSAVFNLQKSSTGQSSYGISCNQAWIWLNPPYGSTQTITTEADPITVTANIAGMAVGTYSGTVYITESGPNGSQTLRIPVSLTITASGTVTPPATTTPTTTPPTTTTPPVTTTPTTTTPATTTPTNTTAPAGALTALLQAFPGSLTLTAPQGGANPSAVFNLQKSSTGQSSYGISCNQGWIWLNPPYGSTQTITTEADPITVTANIAGMAVGSYSGVVYISESGPYGSQTLRIPVSVTVTAAGTTAPSTTTPTTTAPTTTTPPVTTTPPATTAPTTTTPPTSTGSLTALLQAFPSSITLSASQGTNPSGTFNLQKSSTQQSSYGISCNQSWIWLNPPYGSTQTITTEADPITVTVNTAALGAGTHSGVVYISESGPNGSNMLRIPVSVTVSGAGKVLQMKSNGGKLEFSLPQGATPNYRLCVYDLAGKKVYEAKTAAGQKQLRMEQRLKNGVYFARFGEGKLDNVVRFNVMN